MIITVVGNTDIEYSNSFKVNKTGVKIDNTDRDLLPGLKPKKKRRKKHTAKQANK